MRSFFWTSDSEEEFPELNDGEEQHVREKTRGSSSRLRRSHKGPRRASSSRNEWDDLQLNREEQSYNTIVVETVLARVREDLVRQLKLRTWLKPLIDLRNEIATRTKEGMNELDTDQLVVFIFGRINEIIENNPEPQQGHRRICQNNKNGE